MILPEVVDDLILGMDYLREIGATLSIGNEVFRFDKEKTSTAPKVTCTKVREKAENGDVIIKQLLKTQRKSFETATGTSKSVEYRKGRSNKMADELSREPSNKLCATTSEPLKEKCAWWERKKKEVLGNPEKHADFVIENGQLYRHIPSRDEADGGLQWKLCVPKYQREGVLKEIHDSARAGHLGSRKTTARVARRYYWPGLLRDVASYVRRCESCQKYKVSQRNSSVSESIGYSPSFVRHGREPRLQKALYDEVTVGTSGDVQEPGKNAKMLQDIFKLVRRNMEVAAQDQRGYYNLRRRSWKPRKGDRVLIKQHHLSNVIDEFAAKLALKYDGPYTVKGFVSPVIVEFEGEGRRRTAHIGERKPFNVSK